MATWDFLNVIPRRSRLLLGTGLALVIILSLLTTSDKTRNLHLDRIIKNSVLQAPYTFKGQALFENPHHVDDADDLLPHLKAVTQYPGMPMRDAKSGCGWPDESALNLQWDYDDTRGEDMLWVVKDEDDFKIDLIRKQWQYFVANEMRPWSAHRKRFKGKGIVIPAGHPESVHRTKVILNMLNKVGSSLPVEIAYWGEEELKDDAKQQLLSIRPNVYFNDLASEDQPIPTYYTPMNNFHLKIPAVINSRFAEIILLDSDNIPVIDPALLFESEVYKEYGTVFWPDVVRTRKQNPIWAITNTKCRMDEWEQESGQLLVDKRKFWYHLQLATWLETEHKSYYELLILGDKDMFRFAWHALKTPFGVPSRWITSVGTLSPGPLDRSEQVYCGHSFAQHHPDKDGEIAFLHGGLLKTMDARVVQWQLENAGGIFQAYKRAGGDQDKRVSPKVQSIFDPVHYFPEKPKDFRTPWCLDFPNSAPESLEDLLPGFQQTFYDAGGYWMLEEADMTEVAEQMLT